MAKIDLSNPTRRDALQPRSSFYAHPLGSKRYVLMRVGARGRVWGARVPGRPDKTIGPVEAHTFDQVATMVREMAEVKDSTPDDLVTIGEVVDTYVARCAKTKAKAPMATINGHVKRIAPLCELTIATTPLRDLNKWRDDLLTDRRGPVGVNKIVGTLKAALNACGIPGDWTRLKKLKEPRKGVADRTTVMTVEQVRHMLSVAGQTDPELYNWLEALWLTGARPSEIREAHKAALTGCVLTLTGKTGTRDIRLKPRVAAWFAERAEACNTHFVEVAGKPIHRDALRYRFKALVNACGDDLPDGVTLYSLRHSFITAALYAGVPTFALAAHCGTSPEMVQQTYGHVIAGLQDDAFDALTEVLL